MSEKIRYHVERADQTYEEWFNILDKIEARVYEVEDEDKYDIIFIDNRNGGISCKECINLILNGCNTKGLKITAEYIEQSPEENWEL